MAADQDQCTLSLPDLKRKFQVLQIEGWEEVSRGFCFQVNVMTDSAELAYAQIMFQAAQIDFHAGDSMRSLGCMVSACQVHPAEGNSQVLHLELRPLLYKLAYSVQCRVFQKESLQDIITKVLQANQIPMDSVEFKTKRLDDIREFVVQYNESDLDFISRLLEREGVYRSFTNDGKQTKLLIADENASVPMFAEYPELKFMPKANMAEDSQEFVYNLARKMRGSSANFGRKAYGYQDPNSNLHSQKAITAGAGEDYRYLSDACDMPSVTASTSNEAEIALSHREIVTGETSCHLLHAGMRVKIAGNTAPSFSGEYFLVRLKHTFAQAGSVLAGGKSASYRVQFECIPVAVAFRPEQTTPKPKVAGILPARTGGADDQYASLDDSGRYRVQFPFDLRTSDDGNLSLPVRLAQPYGGAGFGSHFPLHRGTELLIAFEDGDVDRPIALGTAPNPSNASPVTSANASQNVLKSAMGHRICLDDNNDKPIVEIVTAAGHILRLTDTPDSASITLQTKAGHKVLLDDKNQQMVISSPNGETILTMNTKDAQISAVTKKGHTLMIDDKNDMVMLQSAKKQKVCLDDAGKKLTLQDADAKHTIEIDGGGKISIHTEGDLLLSAKGSLKLSGKDVSIASDSADVSVKSAGKLNLQGANVNVKSDQRLTMEAGMDASLKGGTNLKLEGTVNAELKAGVALKATGTMANLEASGIATIKGAMVMVN